MNLPLPTCPSGYTQDDLEALLGPGLHAFMIWMSGQTMMLCDGKGYIHKREHNGYCAHEADAPFTWECGYAEGGHYESTSCSGMLPGMPVSYEEPLTGHGVVVYRSDLERYLLGLPIID